MTKISQKTLWYRGAPNNVCITDTVNRIKIKILIYFTDLKNTEYNNEAFLLKVQRAQEALSQNSENNANSLKTLCGSFGSKWPYKRTMSAPASTVQRQETKQGK